MKLSCALVACNDNPHYLAFWPAVKKAWWDVVKIPCIMVYVAETIPKELEEDSAVIHFKPIEGWPTATQAQVIRLLYPALLKADGAIVLSDMDMIPMQHDFFHNGFAQFHTNQFVSLRGIDEQERQIYMCYVGATPQTWSELFGIETVKDVRTTLENWAHRNPADGNHGGTGWCTDQQILYVAIKGWEQECPNRIGLLPWTQTIPRLDRGNPNEWLQYSQALGENIQTFTYIDFHMPPYYQFKQQIDGILYLAIRANQHQHS
jgi:hypothetical protein